jgi:branched-chain amino acid transport system ATP-binding protein
MPEPLLEARAVEAGYPGKQILFGVDLAVEAGEVVALLGANGSGKSTALNTLSGFVRPWAGSIRFAGTEIAGEKPHRIFRRGIVQISQARDLFGDMSVEDNLRLGAAVRRGTGAEERPARIYDRFPRLAERKRQPVRQMSGGEQQMVAFGRALMAAPSLLLLDEPSGGLAPAFVAEIGAIMQGLKAEGITMVLIEQNLKLALAVADRFLILRDGRVSERHDLRAGGVAEEAIVRSIYL